MNWLVDDFPVFGFRAQNWMLLAIVLTLLYPFGAFLIRKLSSSD